MLNKFAIVTLLFLASATASATLMGTIEPGTNPIGFFTNPNPSCPPAACTISGTHSEAIAWGNPAPGSFQSALTFTPQSFNVALGTPFVIGQLFFRNGEIASGEISHVTLSFNTGTVKDSSTNQVDKLHTDQNVTLDFDIVNTPNTTDTSASADIVHISNNAPWIKFPNPDPNPCDNNKVNSTKHCDSFHVIEGQQTSVDILFALGSVDLVGFGNVADPSAGFVTSAVSAPSTIGLLGIGLLAMIVFAGYKKQAY